MNRLREQAAATPPANGASSMSESERMIRGLYEVTADAHSGMDEKVQRLLALGCARFDMEIGVVAEVSDDRYIIRHLRAPPDLPLTQGQQLDLDQTFGGVALHADGSIALARLDGPYADYAAVKRFGLRAYIGCPIRSAHKIYGTLSFSSRREHDDEFRPVDLDALQLTASWIGAELQRQQSTEELRQLNAMLLRYKDALEAANRQLREQNRLDELTGIANRRTAMEELRTLLVRGARTGTPVTVIAIDADDFKAINDTHGHQAGDSTLKRIARVLVDLTREGDLVGRLGGEEFIVLLPQTGIDAGRPLAERLRAGVRSIRGLPHQPSISLGVASYLHREGKPIHVERVLNELLVRADQAMYRAKHNGKNKVCVAAG